MPLILAIVADPQEAAQLAQLIQGRLSVDLVQAAEVGEGLLTLNDRIPDLILTSPLMSPFDDGVLDEYLRDLGPAGAHVQTLRIPVLSQAPKKKPRLGFSLRRRSKPEPTAPEGCEPKVFADEIEQYLARAAEEKRHTVSNEAVPVAAREYQTDPGVEEEWTPAYDAESTPVYRPDKTPLYRPDPTAEQAVWPASEPEAEVAAWSAPESEDEKAVWSGPSVEEAPTYEPYHYEAASSRNEEALSAAASIADVEVERASAEPIDVAEAPAIVTEPIKPESEAAVIAAPATVASIDTSKEPVTGLPEQAAVVQDDLASATTRTVVAREDIASGISRTPPTGPNAIKATPSFKAALAAIRAAWGKPPRKADQNDVVTRGEQQASSSTRATLETAALDEESEPMAGLADTPAPVEVDLTGAVEMLDEQHAAESWVPAPPEPSAQPASALEAEEVYELSVEPDLREFESRVFTPLARAPKRTAAATPVVEPRPSRDERRTESSSDRRMKKKRGSKGAKAKAAAQQPQTQEAVQDEWGLFDPNRCGFAAVVEKLDEVADKKAERPQNGNKVRVISYS